MTILDKLLKRSPQEPRQSATRVDARMSDEQRERELERLRDEGCNQRSEEEVVRYQRRLARLRAHGVPVRQTARADWEERQARRHQRRLVA